MLLIPRLKKMHTRMT